MTPFMLADVGRDIVSGAGYGTITAYIDPNNVTVEIKQAFLSTTAEEGAWKIVGSPQATCTPSAASPVGASITLTLSASGWRAEDVGKYVEINGGLVQITGYTSSTVVAGLILREMTSAVGAQAMAWVLNSTVWGGVNGYPRCGTLYQQRLYVAGSPGFPQTVWGSVIGEYFDFLLGVNDDEALSYTIASNEINPILHLVQARGLVALTYGGEFSIRGGNEKPITPTNIQVDSQSNYGCSPVVPARVANELYFVQRANRKVRALAPDRFDSSTYGAPDMSVLSEHVTASGVRDLAYQQEPDSVVYFVRNDGQLATLTVDRDQDVVAWARQVTRGNFESVAAIPAADGERVFAVVARVVNGQTHRYVEMLDSSLLTDSALTGASAGGATVWTGLDHLEGRSVNVKADGVALQDRIVSGGQITIERPAYSIEIGLNYYTTILTLTPEIVGQTGSSQGSAMSINEIVVRLRDTTGCYINRQVVAFSKFGLEVLDKPPPVFTGDKKAGNIGWGQGVAQTLIEQRRPYPLHLLAVFSQFTANDG